MQVVINESWYGFKLPRELRDKFDAKDKATRLQPELIEYVLKYPYNDKDEERLRVIEIPDNITDFDIVAYDDWETIVYVIDGKLYWTKNIDNLLQTSSFIDYKIPNDIQQMIDNNDFYLTLYQNICVSFHLTKPDTISLNHLSGTAGMHDSVRITCQELNINEVFDYYDHLEWYDNDAFDDTIIYQMIDKLNLK